MRTILCLLLAVLALTSAQANWRSDERMVATVDLPRETMTLSELCADLAKQTSSEFYVDRRHGDTTIAWHAGRLTLKTAMGAIESATGLEWRMVGDMFFLSRGAEGLARTGWNRRFEEAKKAHAAGLVEEQVRDWVYRTSPFPPRTDPHWELTLLQREQLAYHNALLLFTMTPPQLNWLEAALCARNAGTTERRYILRQIASVSPELSLEINTAMVMASPAGEYLLEMPLDVQPVEEVSEEPEAEEEIIEEVIEPAEDIILAHDFRAVWVTDVPNENLLKQAKSAGFNAVLVPVLSRGHTTYPSRHLPQQRQFSGSDPLRDVLQAARTMGLKVHSVLDATLWGDAEHPVPKPAAYSLILDRNLAGRTFAEQEKWQASELSALDPSAAAGSEDRRVYLCPASSQLPRLLRSVVEEIAARYAVDGICLDGVDYPRSSPFILAGKDFAQPFGYTLEVRREMIRLNQVDPIDVDPEGIRRDEDVEDSLLWNKFRRGRLTGLVGEVAAAFKSLNTKGLASATFDPASDAVSPEHWAKLDSVDIIIPLVEAWQSDDGEGESSEVHTVRSLSDVLSKNAAVVPAVMESDPEAVLEQVTALSGMAQGLKGIVLKGDARALEAALQNLAN